jgi:putative pyruvate formate lyase activating enzyme
MSCMESGVSSFFFQRETFQPAYLQLHRSGELRRRAELALAGLSDCTLCPRACHADRVSGAKGSICRTGRQAAVSSYFAHSGEEDCLRGRRGSGTIFFSLCNLLCVFCQNDEISWEGEGRVTSAEELAGMMLSLQAQGCHNINFVTPSHVVAQILEALPIAVDRGLRLPLVYNSSGYDSLEALALLNGVVDIYMPDFKFWEGELARRYASAPDYPEIARAAIKEMHRQVGPLSFDESGIALRGLLIRHLVMPVGVAGTADMMGWIARELGPETYVNIMAQYRPSAKVSEERFSEINCCVSRAEFRSAIAAAEAAGLRRLDGRSAARM